MNLIFFKTDRIDLAENIFSKPYFSLQTLDLCSARTFPDQVSWAFRIFDCDNSQRMSAFVLPTEIKCSDPKSHKGFKKYEADEGGSCV